jgi:hypothetical protein
MGAMDLETPGTASKRRGSKALSRLRNCLLFKPLALILALQFVPPEAGNWSLVTPAHAQSTATTINQLPATCFQNGGAYIIQLLCNDGTFSMSNGQIQTMVQQFETDSITQFLALYQLPNTSSGVQFVYQYGTTDLRSQIRAYMEFRLANVLYEQANSIATTQNEQQFATFFTHMVWRHEKNMWQSALNDFKSWQANRCAWKIDPDLALAFSIHYIPCVGSVVADTAPTYPYFYYAARKREYDQLLANLTMTSGYLAPATSAKPRSPASGSTTPASSGTSLFAITGTDIDYIVGSLVAVAGLTAGAMALSKIPIIAAKIYPSLVKKNYFANQRNKISNSDDQAPKNAEKNVQDVEADDPDPLDAPNLGNISGSLSDTVADIQLDGAPLLIEGGADLEVSEALAPEAVGAIIAVAVLLVVLAVTFAVEEAQAQTAELDQLTTENNGVQSSPPPLWEKLLDVNGEGQYKMEIAWVEATYPDVPSTAAPPAPDGTQGTLIVNDLNSSTFTDATYNVLTYQDWDNNTRTAVLYQNWWETSGTVTIGSTAVPFSSITPTLRYLDNNNNQMSVSRYGNLFVVTDAAPGPNEAYCQLGTIVNAGLAPPEVGTCTSYVSSQFSAQNGPNSLTVSIGTLPAFQVTSPTFFNTVSGSRRR